MKAVIQRVINASVTVDRALKGAVGAGLLVYLGVAHGDTETDANWLAEKIINMRIFDDSEGKMNLSLIDIVNQNKKQVNENYVNHDFLMNNKNDFGMKQSVCRENSTGILAISQFTLLGDARKGRRPSWGRAAPPEQAKELYLCFIQKIREQGILCETGEFQARMMVNYTNDGPVTILLDSKTNEK
jgi:D-tyrosyl-tRNA(Tyr) deacylase